MKFKRIDVETVRCLISEEELEQNGLNMDDFLQNGDKTEDFLRKIVSLAQEEVGYRIPGGSLSVQASILPNHVLSLTLSEKKGQSILDILRNLKNAMTRLSEAVENDDTEAFREILEAMGATDTQQRLGESGSLKSVVKSSYQIEFDSFDHLLHYADSTMVDDAAANVVYYLRKTGQYYLVIHKGRMNDDQMCRLLSAALDFSRAIYSDASLLAFLDEHGEKILSQDALQTLRSL